jgi:hypothetical protein
MRKIDVVERKQGDIERVGTKLSYKESREI